MRTSFKRKLVENSDSTRFYREPSVFQFRRVVSAGNAGGDVLDDAHVRDPVFSLEQGPPIALTNAAHRRIGRVSDNADASWNDETCASFDRKCWMRSPEEIHRQWAHSLDFKMHLHFDIEQGNLFGRLDRTDRAKCGKTNQRLVLVEFGFFYCPLQRAQFTEIGKRLTVVNAGIGGWERVVPSSTPIIVEIGID